MFSCEKQHNYVKTTLNQVFEQPPFSFKKVYKTLKVAYNLIT